MRGALRQISAARADPASTAADRQHLLPLYLSVYTTGNVQKLIGPDITREMMEIGIGAMGVSGGGPSGGLGVRARAIPAVEGEVLPRTTSALQRLGPEPVRSAAPGAPAEGRFFYNAAQNPGPLATMRGQPAANFFGGKYNMKVAETDMLLNRAGKSGEPLGQWFTRTPPASAAQVRIDSAVKPQWYDRQTGALVGSSPLEQSYVIRIPKGTPYYEGPVGPQGGVHVGGPNTQQIFVPEPWKISGVEVISATPLH